MATLVSVTQLRRVVASDLSDSDLQTIITQEEAEVIRRYGAHGDGSATVTEELTGGSWNLFLRRPAASVTSVAERQSLDGAATTLSASSYHVQLAQGRLVRLPEGTRWGRRVTVVYAPADDRARRRQVITELVRLALEQTAMEAESVAGVASFQAPDWEARRAALYRRLTFVGV